MNKVNFILFTGERILRGCVRESTQVACDITAQLARIQPGHQSAPSCPRDPRHGYPLHRPHVPGHCRRDHRPPR